MNQPMQDQGTLVGLRIAVQPGAGNREVTLTATGGGGGPLTIMPFRDDGRLANLHDVLARIAAHTAPAEGGLSYGELDGPRMTLAFEGYTAPHFQFAVTVAYPNGDAGYQATTLRAPVTEAGLARLAEGVRQLKDGETDAIDWTVAD